MNSTALAETLGEELLDHWPCDPAFVPTHREWHFERAGERGSRDLLARILYRNPNRTKNQAQRTEPLKRTPS